MFEYIIQKAANKIVHGWTTNITMAIVYSAVAFLYSKLIERYPI